MNKRKLLIGLALVLIGAWFYFALSTFKIEDTENDLFAKKIVIREGTVRSEDEVAEALSKELDFDLKGAYKTGYTPVHVIEYLINQPHNYRIAFYDGKFYEGRKTVPYIIPAMICMLIALAGIAVILAGFKSRKT